MKLQVPASSLHAWIPSAVLELFLVSTAAQWILWAETRPLQWLSIWVRVAEQLWLPWYYCVFPPYTVPRAVFGEPCENEEIEGSLVVVYCSLFSVALLLRMHSTYVWFAAIDICLRKFCMFRMCFHVYSWFSNPVFFVCLFVFLKEKKVQVFLAHMVMSCFWFSLWVFTVTPVFFWYLTASAQLGNGLFLTSCKGIFNLHFYFFLFCMHKKSRSTQCMIFISWHE